MTQAQSAGQPPSFIKYVVALLLAVVAALYASGYFLLWSLRLEPHTASPLTIPQYSYYYWNRPAVRSRIMWTTGAGFGVVGGIALLILIPRRRSLHGDARWAKRSEIAAAGLFAENGIILGRYRNKFIILGGQQGVILAAPPRSGKGVGVVVPNLLNWPGSLIALDIKKENWTLTAGFRAKFSETFLFDPFAADGCTARWNPLHYVSDNPYLRIDDIQRIAAMLCVEVPGADPFWVKSARSLFVGIALYLFERRDYERTHNDNPANIRKLPVAPVTIGEILRQAMASDEEGFGKHWKRIIEGWHTLGKPLSSQCVALIMDVVDLAPQTASSVRKTFTSQLDLWLNPLLDLATAGNDFDLRDLRKKKMSIYLGVKPRDFERLQAVMNLFFQQAIGEQTVELPEHNPALKYQLLVVLDEFTAIGRVPILLNSIAFVPGYNVRTLMVIQTPVQLAEVYGPQGAKIMMKTLAARVLFAPNDNEDARAISEELGYTTVKSKSRTMPSFMGSGNRNPSSTVSDQRRALLLPQEVKEMGANREIILLENLRPVRCHKIRYFADKRFSSRVLPPPVVRPIDMNQAARGRTDDHFAMWQEQVVRGAQGHVAAPLTVPAAPSVQTSAAVAAAGVGAGLVTMDDEFSVDFSNVKIPDGRRMTPEEINRAVVSFLDQLESA